MLGGLLTFFGYTKESNATVTSAQITTKANEKNTRIAQYNDLFERVSKLEDKINYLYDAQENLLQDRVGLFSVALSLERKLHANGLQLSETEKNYLKNYGNKLHQDDRNSF